MSANLEQEILTRLRSLSEEKQQEVLRFVEAAERQAAAERNRHRPIWEVVAEIRAEVPEEEWDNEPTDGSYNHDHYLYGAPKKKLPEKI